MKIKHVYGNVLKLDIPLTIKIRTMEGDVPTEREEPFYPDVSKGCVVVLNNNYNRKMEYNASLSGNVAHIEDDGVIGIGTYKVTVKCYDEYGNPYRYMVRDIIEICDATIDAGIEAGVEFNAETYTLEGAVFISYGGGSFEQVQSDWDEQDDESKAYIKNKPDLSVYATKNELREVESEIPTLPEHIVTDEHYVHTDNNYTNEEKGKLADLENYDDSGIRQELDDKVDKVAGKGLSTNDFTNEDKSKLNSALQSETDPTVPSWAKTPTKPEYDYSEIANTPSIPTNTSDLNNNSGFITNSVNDLANYYLKSETYTKTEVGNLIAAIQQFHYEIYASISDVTSPAGNVLYLIGPTGTGSDKYEEYVYDSTKQEPWVKIGDTSIDLSGYVTTTALNTALADYTTTANLTTLLAGKQNVIDATHKLSADFVDDSNTTNKFVTSNEKQAWNNKSDFSGSYNDLTDKPTIPTALSQLSEDTTHRTVSDTEKTTWGNKQEALVSGTNIKTINNQSLLGGGNITIEGDQRELLQLNLTTDQTGLVEDPLDGVSVKIVLPDNTEIYSGTWHGEQLSIRIGSGSQYKIVLEDIPGYITPASKWIYPVLNSTRSLTKSYIKSTIDVVYIDDSIADPSQKVTGDVNGVSLQIIRSRIHNYLCKYNANDGKLYACQLDDTTRLKFYDGTTAKTDGTMGDVMNILPDFYTKYEKDENNRHKISFSLLDGGEGWKHWGGLTDALGCYEMIVKNNKGYSITGIASTANFTKDSGKSYARARGIGFTCVKQWHQNIYGTLFYALYGHTNCQEACGYGTNSVDKICGADTDKLGMRDTVHNVNGDNGSINFLGLENWWGNKAEWFDNVVFNESTLDYVYRITEDDGTVRAVQGHSNVNVHTYKRGMTFGDNLDLIGTPSSANGTDSTGYCDSNLHTNKTARVVCRSDSYANTIGGVACSGAGGASSSSGAHVGSRLAFHGTIEIVNNVQEFLEI